MIMVKHICYLAELSWIMRKMVLQLTRLLAFQKRHHNLFPSDSFCVTHLIGVQQLKI
jgi:hypothetical protein